MNIHYERGRRPDYPTLRDRGPARPGHAAAGGPVVHVGATETSPPLADVMPATGELRQVGHTEDVEDLIVEADQYRAARADRNPEPDVHDELSAIDDALAVFDVRMRALLAAWMADIDPTFVYRLHVAGDDTTEWTTADARRARERGGHTRMDGRRWSR